MRGFIRTKQMLRSWLRLIRVHQLVKNGFIFLPAFFGGRIGDPLVLRDTVFAFLFFSFCTSAVYVFNDLLDLDDDKRHPVKRKRPLAAGDIGPRAAAWVAAGLIGVGLGGAVWLGTAFWAYVAAYLLLNLVYSRWLKHQAILDVNMIALGFILRLLAGAAVGGVDLTDWILIMTYLLALFLAFGKRRDDVLIYEKSGEKMRRALDGYNLRFIDSAMVILASVMLVAYLMYTLSPEVVARTHRALYVSAVFVLLGLMRYLRKCFVDEDSGAPAELLLKDVGIQLAIVGWLAWLGFALYG
jgi:4-hydroxybenzoate polyprenyltransferase